MATAIANHESTALAVSPEAERFALRQRQARMFATSPLVPEHLRKGSPEQAMANCYIALTLAEAMGEVPLIVMQNIHVVSGKAGFASQYMIARANSSGIFRGRIDWRIDRSDPKNLAVTAFAFLKETGDEVSVTVDMNMAVAEGWTKNPKYKSMPEVMLRYRSAAFLVRFYAPDVMLGYQTVEEVEDVVLAAAPVNQPLTAAALLEQAQPNEISTATADDGSAGEADGQPGAEEVAASASTEGRDDSQMGEQTTLADAKAEIDGCELAMDVNARVSALLPLLSEEDGDKLRTYAAERIDGMGAK